MDANSAPAPQRAVLASVPAVAMTRQLDTVPAVLRWCQHHFRAGINSVSPAAAAAEEISKGGQKYFWCGRSAGKANRQAAQSGDLHGRHLFGVSPPVGRARRRSIRDIRRCVE